MRDWSDSCTISGAYWFCRLSYCTCTTFQASCAEILEILTGSVPSFSTKLVSSIAAIYALGAVHVTPLAAAEVSPYGTSLSSPSLTNPAHMPASSHLLISDAAVSCESITGEMKKFCAANQFHAVPLVLLTPPAALPPHVPEPPLSMQAVGNGMVPTPSPHWAFVKTL